MISPSHPGCVPAAIVQAVLCLLLGIMCPSLHAAEGKDIQAFRFNEMHAFQIVTIYSDLVGLDFVISPEANAQTSRPVSMESQTPISKLEMQKLLENALREQAGLVLTKTEDKKILIKYDATLPIKIVTLPKPSTNSITSGGKNSTNAPSLYVPPPPPSLRGKKSN